MGRDRVRTTNDLSTSDDPLKSGKKGGSLLILFVNLPGEPLVLLALYIDGGFLSQRVALGQQDAVTIKHAILCGLVGG